MRLTFCFVCQAGLSFGSLAVNATKRSLTAKSSAPPKGGTGVSRCSPCIKFLNPLLNSKLELELDWASFFPLRLMSTEKS